MQLQQQQQGILGIVPPLRQFISQPLGWYFPKGRFTLINPPPHLASTTTLTIVWLLTGIVQVTASTAITLTLPTSTLTHQGMIGGDGTSLIFDQGVQWSIIGTCCD
jgi:hypothetical protein